MIQEVNLWDLVAILLWSGMVVFLWEKFIRKRVFKNKK